MTILVQNQTRVSDFDIEIEISENRNIEIPTKFYPNFVKISMFRFRFRLFTFDEIKIFSAPFWFFARNFGPLATLILIRFLSAKFMFKGAGHLSF
jgi:hypothetical protein